MTAVAEQQDVQPAPSPPLRGRLSPGWVPLALTVVVTALVLRHYSVGLLDLAAFTAYTLLGNTLPGTLIWRAVRGRSGRLALDAAFGTTAGFAVELPVYLIARELGAPLAVAAWPFLTVVLFLAVPRLRRFWRGSGERLPLGVAWTVAAGFLFTLGLIAVGPFAWSPITEPHFAIMSQDYPFQFALVGEFKYDLPLTTPWVTGSPLQYHWYVYAHGAAASWLTGIEPQTIIMRLLPLPMVAAFLLIAVALVRRISGRWWPANVAVLLILTGVAMTPFAWEDQPTYTGAITDNLIVSPTQTYAALFCIAAVFVLAGILRDPQPRRVRPWIVLTVLLGAVAGAKATFLPMIVCGLLLAVFLRLVTTRRAGPELPALGITLAWFAFAQFVLYGSAAYGTSVDPLQTIKWTPLGQAVMGRQGPADNWKEIVVLTGVALLASGFAWAGLAGLFRREWRVNPIVHVMAGFAFSGIAALWLIVHPGVSQTYFARSATPYVAILSALGLAALLPAGRRIPRHAVALLAGAAALGVLGTFAVQQTIGHDAPRSQFNSMSLRAAVKPYLIVLAVMVVVAVVALLVRRFRPFAVTAIVLALLGGAVISGVAVTGKPLGDAVAAGELPRVKLGGDPRYAIPAGAIRAGRWLRDHSDPHDVVATNSHCRPDIGGCDSRDFWLAAYSERQVVLEGWSYTGQSLAAGGVWDGILARTQFWDQELLSANDAMFYTPTASNVASFTREHGVRWLVSVARTQVPTEIRSPRLIEANPALGQFATERFTTGDITIYEVTG